jgi:DNA-binding transcriptional LysR family regulator
MLSESLHQLHTFYVVVREGTLSAAAQALYVTQPAVSLQIKQLEARLGLVLLTRRGRRQTLTDAGETVFDYARRMFGLMEELERELDDQKGLRSGRLVVGASTTVGEYLLPEALGRYRARYPAIELQLSIGNTTTIIEMVLRHELDFGLVGGASDSPELLVSPFAEDEICFIAPRDHPLVGYPVELRDVVGDRFVLRERGSATRQEAEQCLRAHGLEFKVAMELGSNEAVKQAVVAGLGLGALSKHALRAELAAGQLRVLSVQDWVCRRRFYLIRRRGKRVAPDGTVVMLRPRARVVATSWAGARGASGLPRRAGAPGSGAAPTSSSDGRSGRPPWRASAPAT